MYFECGWRSRTPQPASLGIFRQDDRGIEELGHERRRPSRRPASRDRRLEAFGRNWAASCIRVNAVSPGSIDTPGLSGLLASSETGQERLKMISNNVPLGRLGTPDEIAKAVVFLASDDASYVTGAELFVDGGFAQV